MKPTLVFDKWKRHGITVLGGLLIGAGVADAILATNAADLDQIARGLTIFSAGLTILVVHDTARTQKKTELRQQEYQLKLSKIEHMLLEMQQSRKMTEAQQQEILRLLRRSDR